MKKQDAIDKLRADIEAAYGKACTDMAAGKDADLAELAKTHKLGENANGWKNPYPTSDPRSLLLEYQFVYWHDKSRFKVALWSRQSGKDFTTEGEAVEDCYKTERNEWMIAAPSERQAMDSLEKAKEWAAAFELSIADYKESREGSGSETLLKSAEVTLSNGARLRAVPGKPDTVRGRSANILLTEFDFFENPLATWRAILPSITNPLRGGEKKVRLITTPNGIGSATHGIWTKADTAKMQWSRHLVTLYHAVLMGLPVDVEQIREAFGDPEGFAQEFLCQFLDTSSVLLPYEVIALVENPMATTAMPAEYWATLGGTPVDLGVDFGRKRDLTVCWANEDLGGFMMTKEVLELAKMPTHLQMDVLRPRMRKARRVSMDYTGPGIGLGDLAVAEFGEWNPEQHKFGKVELVTMTNAIKCEIYPAVRAKADQRMLGIPISTVVREDLHAMSRVVTAAGNISYRAPHTEDGHSDRLTGLALAIRAQSHAGAGAIVSVEGIRMGGNGRNVPSFSPRRLA
jgi:phage FluMu gp28-like protein